MSLTYILILFFLVLIFFNLLNEFQSNKNIYWFLILALICISGFRTRGPDYQNYLLIYNGRSLKYVEPGILLIKYLSKFLSNSSTLFFCFFSILGVGIKAIAIRKITHLWVLTLLVYVSYFYIYHDLIQIRTGVASGLLLLLIISVTNKNWIASFIYLIIAVLFHISSLVFIPLLFFNVNKFNKVFYCILLIISFIIGLLKLNISIIISYINFSQINNLYNSYLYSTNLGLNDRYLNVFSTIQLIRLSIAYFLVYRYDIILKNRPYFNLLLKIYILSIIVYNVFSDLPVIAVRISQLLGIVEIILAPLVIYGFNIKSRKIAILFPILVSVIYISTLLFYRNLLNV